MKNQELFDKTVSILVNAYFNNTLQHTNCHACAVGNIVAGNLGYGYIENPDIGEREDFSIVWSHCRNYTVGGNWFHPVVFGGPIEYESLIEIKSTGYTIKQLAEIEGSFEQCAESDNEDQHMFNGLMSVVSCLSKIHKATKQESKTAKDLFVKI